MATLTVRNLDDTLKARLRVSAAKHGWSMEEEARQILKKSLLREEPSAGLGLRIARRFAEVGGVGLGVGLLPDGRRKDLLSTLAAQIAAIARAAGLTLATRNLKDFSGIERLALVDPWT